LEKKPAVFQGLESLAAAFSKPWKMSRFLFQALENCAALNFSGEKP
jgi:hypothetical protein